MQNQEKACWRSLKKCNCSLIYLNTPCICYIFIHLHFSLKCIYLDQLFFLILANSFTLELEMGALVSKEDISEKSGDKYDYVTKEQYLGELASM